MLWDLSNDTSIWGIADGSQTIGVDAEIVAYAVLDVLAKPVFGFWLLFTHDAMAERYADILNPTIFTLILGSSMSLDGFWAHGLGKDGAIRVGDDDDGA